MGRNSATRPLGGGRQIGAYGERCAVEISDEDPPVGCMHSIGINATQSGVEPHGALHSLAGRLGKSTGQVLLTRSEKRMVAMASSSATTDGIGPRRSNLTLEKPSSKQPTERG